MKPTWMCTEAMQLRVERGPLCKGGTPGCAVVCAESCITVGLAALECLAALELSNSTKAIMSVEAMMRAVAPEYVFGCAVRHPCAAATDSEATLVAAVSLGIETWGVVYGLDALLVSMAKLASERQSARGALPKLDLQHQGCYFALLFLREVVCVLRKAGFGALSVAMWGVRTFVAHFPLEMWTELPSIERWM